MRLVTSRFLELPYRESHRKEFANLLSDLAKVRWARADCV